jgi:hypothetical protein
MLKTAKWKDTEPEGAKPPERDEGPPTDGPRRMHELACQSYARNGGTYSTPTWDELGEQEKRATEETFAFAYESGRAPLLKRIEELESTLRIANRAYDDKVAEVERLRREASK